jgi:hypothetical protein
MNAFYEHHKHNILFHYSGFDRILLNGVIQPFQRPERVVGFFDTYRHIRPVTREVLTDIASQYHNWVQFISKKSFTPILPAPDGRRDDFVQPYFRHAPPDHLVVILKAREPARILVSIGNKESKGRHLELKLRWVDQYNFYINDRNFGPMFVRLCPYFPFSARVCLNQHDWLAQQMKKQGIRFQQRGNAFISCSDPEALQKLADSLTTQDLLACASKWLAYLTPFFSDKERRQLCCQHRLFFSQVEYCDNLIFRRRASLEALDQRLLDANRTIGQPDKLTILFGHRITKYHSGKLKTVIENLQLGNPIIRSHYKNGLIKQYVRDHRLLRTEAASNNVSDYDIGKNVDNLPQLRKKLQAITQSYLDIQQDILETFVDRGTFLQLSQPTVTSSGKRIPGLRVDHPRQLAIMQTLVRFSHVAAGGTFSTADLHPHAAAALTCSTDQYKLGSLRYDLSKLRAKDLVQKIPRSRRYQLTKDGYRICVLYLKLFHKIYAPLTAGLLDPFADDDKLPADRIIRLDNLYLAVTTALDNLVEAVGLQAAA